MVKLYTIMLKSESPFKKEPGIVPVELGLPLPENTFMHFFGERYNRPLLRKIAFHGGIVALNYAVRGNDGRQISARQAAILGMRSIGFDREQTAKALDISFDTVATTSNRLYARLDVQGSRHSSTLAIVKAFGTGFFSVEQLAPSQKPDTQTQKFITYFTEGYTSRQIADNQYTNDDKVKDTLREMYTTLGPDRNSIVFYAHLAGWLPLQTTLQPPETNIPLSSA